MTNHHYDNSERLEGVSEQDWREALDELTAYLTWRLRGKTAKGAHSEKVLGMPAFDYYQEEAVVKLIEGDWKWQDHFTLGKQLEKIAANLITKQKERYEREHPWVNENDDEDQEVRFMKRKPELIEFTDDIDQYGDVMDDDGQEELDETYAVVMALVADNEELTLYVQAIQECNSFFDLPEKMGIPIKRVYRLQEKLMRRIDSAKRKGLLDKIEKFDVESKKAEELYKEWGTTREEHQDKMLKLIGRKMKEVKERK